MEKSEKKAMVEYLSTQFSKAQAAFLTDYRGLDVEKLSSLRNALEEQDAEYRVVKNTLAKIAAKGTIIEACSEYLQGPNAMALVYGDPAAAAKALVDFAKEVKKLKIKMGQISGKAIDEESIKSLAALPSRDVLLAQTLSVMQAVPTSFVRALSGVLTNLMNLLRAVREQKEGMQ